MYEGQALRAYVGAPCDTQYMIPICPANINITEVADQNSIPFVNILKQ